MEDRRGRQRDEDKAPGRRTAQVLATKLYVPPARPNAIARPHLITKLITGVGRPGSFTLLSGPAGFGKTTLLGEFLAQYRQPAAWVSLDAGDNDPARFWTYLITACQALAESIGEAALELLDASQRLPDETIPTLLINDLALQDRSILLVLDDYHEIQDRSIQAGLLFVLEHLPSTLHIIVSTRIDPPWPLARFRARNQLIEIRAQELRFSGDEAAQFLKQTMALQLSDEDIVALEERTEGWIAGLQLAALSLQGREDVPAFIRAFTGSHVYVAEYLMEEILQRQPEAIERFLLLTSALDRMNAGLCEAVTACQDGQAILTQLHRANSFIIPLDSEGHWFRYHHLFADLLRSRLRQYLSAEAIAAHHQRAAGWYEGHGFVSEAIRHALQAGDFERAASLVDEAGQKRIFTEQNTLKAWLDALPDTAFQAHPRLEIYRVLLALSAGKLDMAEQTLREKEALIEALPPSPENDRLRLEAMVYLALFFAHQNTAHAIQIAQATLAELPDGEHLLRAFVYSALYRAYGMEGDIDLSAPAYAECLRLAQAADQYGMVSVTTMVRAFDLCQYGRLDEAVHYCRVILDAGTHLGRKTFYAAGPSHIGLAGIYLEWNELEAAERHLSQGIELCRQTGSDGLYTGYLQRARLRQAQGDPEGALEELQLLEQIFGRWDFTFTIRQVSVCLARNDIAGASRLVGPIRDILGDSLYAQRLPLIAREAFKLSLARIYLAQGEIERCSRVLDEVEATVEPGQRSGRLMEVHLLRALAEHRRQGGRVSPETIAHLERALTLAASAGFVLLILEEGPALIPLLEAVLNHRAGADNVKRHARKLLTAFAGMGQFDAGPPPGKVPGLVEALTPREMEVLLLIATGDSNQTIADKLVITVRTVKKHTTNILGKLDATNRTQAVARARDLGLLPSD